ncbi:MAG TPA: sugar kinase, partial [Alteromonas macleodii]|nr:sugar kinase [Alteromonas macleodii]
MSIVDTNQRMVIFGECMVELRSTQRESSVSTRDENTDNNLMAKSFAGDTYNTAVYLKRCLPSSSISYLTAIGADFLSDELLFKMGEHEINTDLVFRSSSRNLGLYM